MEERRRIIAVDFDGTLHPYTKGWQGLECDHDEGPTEGAADFLMMCASRRWDVVIFSCRAEDAIGKLSIVSWLTKYGLVGLIADVTHEKPTAFAYVDDRAVQFAGDWVDVLEDAEVLHAHPSGPVQRV